MYKGFPINLTQLIRCQENCGGLKVEDFGAKNDFIWTGSLKCNTCGAVYNINEGILELMPHQGPLESIVQQEVEARDRQAKDYDNMVRNVGQEPGILSTLEHLGSVAGKTLIEFGCGTGIFTTRLAQSCKQIVALDFSKESLIVLAEKLRGEANIGLVLADVTEVHITPSCFDLALSAQVLEHIPKQGRYLFYERVLESLVPNGIFVSTSYYQSLWRRISRSNPEGYHTSGIFYHRFSKDEITREIGRYFQIMEAHPIRPKIPLVRRLHLPVVRLSRAFEALPILRETGQLILVKACKRP
jgi:ubiquinone/menaquinone biosynthesis C-methylase UbiE/uncharacterized protein YbaR (Trm112 family)